MPGEKPRAYRARLLGRLARYHPEFKNANLSREEMPILDAFEKPIFDAALAEARHPKIDLPEDGFRKIVRKDESGRDIVEWVGPHSFVTKFAAPTHWRASGRFKTPQDFAVAAALGASGVTR